jgi:hypothetical protein
MSLFALWFLGVKIGAFTAIVAAIYSHFMDREQ